MGNVLQPLTKGGRNSTDTGLKFSCLVAVLLQTWGQSPTSLLRCGFWPTNRTLTRLLTGSLRTRRRARRRFTAFCARVSARPRGFRARRMMSTRARERQDTTNLEHLAARGPAVRHRLRPR